MANNNERWNEDDRWAGEADYGQERDRYRGYSEGRYAEGRNDRYGEQRSYRGDDYGGSRSRGGGGGLRGGARVNQDIGYGSAPMSSGGYASTRAPGSFAEHGASSSGGYGEGYGAYGGPTHRHVEPRGYGEGGGQGYQRESYRGDRYQGRQGDDRFGERGAFATDDMLDRQARGEDQSFWSRMFGRDRDHNEGGHRGRGPKSYKRADDRIRDDINDRLTDDSWLDAQDINVEVKDREVTLSGTVMSREDKRRAETLAEFVSGVEHVQNNLRVSRAQEDRATQLGKGGTGKDRDDKSPTIPLTGV